MIEFLLALIMLWTGIAHTVDPNLTAIAQRRAIEVSTDATFSHDGMDPCCYEILAWNSGTADPVTTAMEQWRGSPSHWAILTNPTLTVIGCGYAKGQENRDVFACVLTQGQARAPAPTPVTTPAPVATTAPAPHPPPTTPTVTVLPNTAMGE